MQLPTNSFFPKFLTSVFMTCVTSCVVAQSSTGIARTTDADSPKVVVGSLYSAIGKGDVQGAASHLDINADFFITPGMPHQAPFYKGRDAFVKQVWVELKAVHVPDISATASEMLSGTDQVTVIGRYKGTSRLKRALDIPFVHVWTVRAGQITELRVFTDTNMWRAALVE
jgi:ketosteroid isomerase-like protein